MKCFRSFQTSLLTCLPRRDDASCVTNCNPPSAPRDCSRQEAHPSGQRCNLGHNLLAASNSSDNPPFHCFHISALLKIARWADNSRFITDNLNRLHKYLGARPCFSSSLPGARFLGCLRVRPQLFYRRLRLMSPDVIYSSSLVRVSAESSKLHNVRQTSKLHNVRQ